MSEAGSQLMRAAVPLAAFGILIALGVWQLERREWKNDIVARLEQALTKPPENYQRPRAGDSKADEFKRVKVTGEFQNAQTIKMLFPTPEAARPQTQEGFGYMLFVPLAFEKGVVFVNRGFVPQSLSDKPELFSHGEVTITGIVRTVAPQQWFTPPAEPGKRVFYAADIPGMAAAAGLGGERVVVNEYIDAEPAPGAAEWPKARDPRNLLMGISNRHLEYALTWFGLAAVLAAACAVLLAKAVRTRPVS